MLETLIFMFQCEGVSVMVSQVMHPLASLECPLRRLGASSRILKKAGMAEEKPVLFQLSSGSVS